MLRSDTILLKLPMLMNHDSACDNSAANTNRKKVSSVASLRRERIWVRRIFLQRKKPARFASTDVGGDSSLVSARLPAEIEA